MNLKKFIQALLPSLERNDVVDDLKESIKGMEQILPSLGEAVSHFRLSPMKSEDNEYLRKEFYRNWTAKASKKSGNFLEDIQTGVSNAIDNAKYVLESIQTEGTKYIVSDSVTARHAAVLRASGAMSFIARFVPDVLNLVYVNEAIAANADMRSSIDVKAPARIRVNKNISNLGVAITDYGMPRKEFEKIIGKIPDVFVAGDRADVTDSVYRPSELDPFESSSVISNAFENPIFSVRMVFAQWQIARHNATKYKLEQLRLRLLHLQNLQNQQHSPAAEKEIERLQDRIDKIDREIHDTEKELGVE